MADFHFRANSKRAMFKLGIELGLIIGIGRAAPTPLAFHYLVGVEGFLNPKDGFMANGYMTLKPEVEDREGVIITPIIKDHDHCYANVRISGGVALTDRFFIAEVADDATAAERLEAEKNRSLIRREFELQGRTVNVESQRRVKTHTWDSWDLGDGDSAESIWPPPAAPQRTYS